MTILEYIFPDQEQRTYVPSHFVQSQQGRNIQLIYSNFQESKMTSSHLILTLSVLIIFESKFVAATKILNIAEFLGTRFQKKQGCSQPLLCMD